MSKELEKRIGSVTVEGARIIFRNFAGKEGQYNREGDRNFALVLPDEEAEQMLDDGWNVKYLRARDEDETPTPYVQVSVSYKGRPPRVVMITKTHGQTRRVTLPEDLIELLDFADLSSVDVILNPYQWSVNGNTGVKAYLKTIFATVQLDALEEKYADVPEVDFNGSPLQIASEAYEDEIIEGEIVEDED